MEVYSLLFLLIALTFSSAQMESGSGDTEPEEPSPLCYNPYTHSSVDDIVFDNTTDALQYGQCISACFAEVTYIIVITLDSYYVAIPELN